jgi:sugar phosphate isomerase/epimerase
VDTRAIRIGNQTNCHTQATLPFEFALRHGFDAFEWFSDKGRAGWREDDASPEERERLRQTSRERDMLFSVHTPHAADPSTPEGADAVRRSIRFAGEVGAGVVNVHLFPEHGARAFAASLGPLLEAATVAGVRLSLENTPQTSPDDFNAVFDVLSAVPDAFERIGMCFDMGHANLFSGTRNNYLHFLDSLGEHVPINHLHAHENWGDRDSHLTLFTGPSDHDDRGVRGLAQRLLSRGFRGSVVLEQWPNPPEQLIHARERLKGLLGSVEKELPSKRASKGRDA